MVHLAVLLTAMKEAAPVVTVWPLSKRTVFAYMQKRTRFWRLDEIV